MIILGLDQSFTCSGFVVLDDNVLIHCERFKTTKEDNIYERTWKVVSRVKELVREYNPEYIAIEGLAFASVGNATRDLAGLQFAIISCLCYQDGIPFKIAPPTAVKKEATGKGRVDKMELVEALPIEVRASFDAIGVKKTTGLRDLADAYWIAITTQNNQKICMELDNVKAQ